MHWFKSNGDIAEWVDFAYRCSCNVKGPRLHPAQEVCFSIYIFLKTSTWDMIFKKIVKFLSNISCQFTCSFLSKNVTYALSLATNFVVSNSSCSYTLKKYVMWLFTAHSAQWNRIALFVTVQRTPSKYSNVICTYAVKTRRGRPRW